MSLRPCRLLPAVFLSVLAAGAQAAPALAEALQGTAVVLMGEVHDNTDGHRERLALLTAAVGAGWRPAIAMEQFDRESQPALTMAQQRCGQDADCVIAAARTDNGGWDWRYYRPVVALAQRYQLPLLAANVSRADAARVARAGFPAALDAASIARHRLTQALPADLAAGQGEAVRDGHCRLLPDSAVPGMVNAQVARDVFMADVLDGQSGRGVVLLAGNGHVRRDLGVPRWLSGDRPSLVIGFVEQDPPEAAFDHLLRLAPVSRPDPCAALAAPR